MKQKTIRNNNPGNIRRNNANVWEGECSRQTDSSFVRFVDRVHGYRAMMILLQNYVKRSDCRSLHRIISRWAPPSENRTQTYIDFVARRMGMAPTESPDLACRETLLRLCAAITRMEHGVEADRVEMEQAWELIGG